MTTSPRLPLPSPASDTLSRRQLLQTGVAASLLGNLASAAPKRRPRVAAIYTICTYRSHAHVILENFLGPYLFNGNKTDPGVDVVSIYADQRPDGSDMTGEIAKQFKLPVFKTIDDALCVGGEGTGRRCRVVHWRARQLSANRTRAGHVPAETVLR